MDAGGTRTTISIVGPGGGSLRNRVVTAPFGSAAGRAALGQAAEQIVAEIANAVHGSPAAPVAIVVAAAAFGDSNATEVAWQLSQALRRIGRAGVAIVMNDATGLLLGASGGHGVAVISGTGSVVVARRKGPAGDQFDTIRLGGEEWPASDEGSGFHVAFVALHVAKRIEDAAELGRRHPHVDPGPHGSAPRPGLAELGGCQHVPWGAGEGLGHERHRAAVAESR